LTLGYTCPAGMTIGFNKCSVAYTVQVPRNTSVEVEDDSGRVTLTGIGGTVDASVSSGDIFGTDLGGSQVTLLADSGRIQLNGVDGSLQARASSGDIQADDLRGAKVSANADSGQVRLKFATAPTNVDVRVSSGNIRLWLPNGQSYAVDASVDSGSKSIGVPQDVNSPHKINAAADGGNVTISPAE
jgi:DUF4097 and DUF4098 domain-containing protein YvlB